MNWQSVVIHFIPRHFVAWTIALILFIQGYFLVAAANGSILPFGWNIPKVPFVACGQPAPQLDPGPQGVAYTAGAGWSDLRDHAPDVGQIRAGLQKVAHWAGSTVGSFIAGMNGGDPPTVDTPTTGAQQVSSAPCSPACADVAPKVVTAAAAARAAGFTGADLVTAVAVAGAESGYRPGAANPSSSARGLWQIMQSAHRDKLVGQWSDPFDSATVAHKVWVAAGQSWKPWVGFTSGAYKDHMGEAQQASTCVTPVSSVSVSGRAEVVIAAAQSYLGVPYVFGGSSRSGVDCSGLMLLAFKAAGVRLPRVSADQMRAGTPVPMSQLQPGDLVGFDNSGRNSGADHVAMFIGGGQIIEAARPGTLVRIRPLLPSEGGFATRIL